MYNHIINIYTKSFYFICYMITYKKDFYKCFSFNYEIIILNYNHYNQIKIRSMKGVKGYESYFKDDYCR
ncbi:hypothetical protein CNEO3_20026 [Clostridium neonatale]|nr:hypothetical protein CNEO_490014 [Clostridium neonatale]CAI3614483.1 hypothetical protein CNEO3_20026 [Clostridium neonatale]